MKMHTTTSTNVKPALRAFDPRGPGKSAKCITIFTSEGAPSSVCLIQLWLCARLQASPLPNRPRRTGADPSSPALALGVPIEDLSQRCAGPAFPPLAPTKRQPRNPRQAESPAPFRLCAGVIRWDSGVSPALLVANSAGTVPARSAGDRVGAHSSGILFANLPRVGYECGPEKIRIGLYCKRALYVRTKYQPG